MKENHDKWQIMAPLGLLMIGLGISLSGEATIRKGNKRPFLSWALMGTLGLVAINAGISIFGDAVKHRTLYEIEREKGVEL